MATEKDY